MGKIMDEKDFTEGKESFVGVVLASRLPCDCESCQKGNEKKTRTYDQWHIVIEPLTVYTSGKKMHNWLSGKTKRSSMYKFLTSISDAGVKIDDTEDLVDGTFLWDWLKTGDSVDKTQEYGIWIVNRELTKEEINKVIGLDAPDVNV